MKIAFGITKWSRDSTNLDGLGVYTKELYKALLDLDIELKLYSFNKSLIDKQVCKSPTPFSLHAFMHHLLNIQIEDLSRCIDGCDILFTPDHYIAYSKTLPRVATIMDIIPIINTNWVSPSKLRRVKNYLFTSAIQKCSRIITVSNNSKNDLINYLGISKDIIDVVPLGVDVRFFADISDKDINRVLKYYSLKKGKFFLNIGTLQPRKNILAIIKAHKLLPKEIRRKYPLIVVGKYGWMAEDIVEAMRDFELQGYGKWLSHIPDSDLVILLKSATAMLYPSLYEGFGLPILEAFASKCPVIASNTSSIPEVAGDCAILLNPNDIIGFSEAMKRVIEQDISSMVDRGFNKALFFTWHNSAIEHLKVFQKLLSTSITLSKKL